jgi:hypothetical protein
MYSVYKLMKKKRRLQLKLHHAQYACLACHASHITLVILVNRVTSLQVGIRGHWREADAFREGH